MNAQQSQFLDLDSRFQTWERDPGFIFCTESDVEVTNNQVLYPEESIRKTSRAT